MAFDDARMRHGHGSEEIMRMYLHLAPATTRGLSRMIPHVVANVGPNDGTKGNVDQFAELRKAV